MSNIQVEQPGDRRQKFNYRDLSARGVACVLGSGFIMSLFLAFPSSVGYSLLDIG